MGEGCVGVVWREVKGVVGVGGGESNQDTLYTSLKRSKNK